MAALGSIGDAVAATAVSVLLSVPAATGSTARAMFIPDGATSYDGVPKTISGTVRDSSNLLVSRTIRVYRRDNGTFLGTTSSSATDGTFSLAVPYTGEVNVLCLDDVAGTTENDLVHRTTGV
jgi:hypothetical protein